MKCWASFVFSLGIIIISLAAAVAADAPPKAGADAGVGDLGDFTIPESMKGTDGNIDVSKLDLSKYAGNNPEAKEALKNYDMGKLQNMMNSPDVKNAVSKMMKEFQPKQLEEMKGLVGTFLGQNGKADPKKQQEALQTLMTKYSPTVLKNVNLSSTVHEALVRGNYTPGAGLPEEIADGATKAGLSTEDAKKLCDRLMETKGDKDTFKDDPEGAENLKKLSEAMIELKTKMFGTAGEKKDSHKNLRRKKNTKKGSK